MDQHRTTPIRASRAAARLAGVALYSRQGVTLAVRITLAMNWTRPGRRGKSSGRVPAHPAAGGS